MSDVTRGTAAEPTEEPAAGEVEEPLDEVEELLNAQADAAEEFLEGLLAKMGIEGSAEADIDGDDVVVDITGPDLAVLIGHHGATVDSVQDLVRSVIQHRSGERANLMVDIGGYRAKRREVLADRALKAAAEVVSSGRAKTLEPMSPYERKTIHDACADIDGVYTESIGEGPDRAVVIKPGSGQS